MIFEVLSVCHPGCSIVIPPYDGACGTTWPMPLLWNSWGSTVPESRSHRRWCRRAGDAIGDAVCEKSRPDLSQAPALSYTATKLCRPWIRTGLNGRRSPVVLVAKPMICVRRPLHNWGDTSGQESKKENRSSRIFKGRCKGASRSFKSKNAGW